MTREETAPAAEATLADEPEVRRALAEASRASVATVVTEHPASPLAWTELADLADSEGRTIEAYAYAAVAVQFAREQLAAAGWQPGASVPWADEPNRAYLRALDTQRRAADALGLAEQAARLSEELASADAEAPARIASEFTPTQMMPIVSAAALFTPAEADVLTADPNAEPAVSPTARED